MSRLGARVGRLEGASTYDDVRVLSGRSIADDGELAALLAGVKPDHRGRVWLIGRRWPSGNGWTGAQGKVSGEPIERTGEQAGDGARR